MFLFLKLFLQMTEETPTNNPCAEETPTSNPSNEETSVSNPSNEKTPISTPPMEKKLPEVVANPEFISWEYPPYCELCNVYFSGEPCSKTHFEGTNHKNRLHTWQKYRNPDSPPKTKDVLCRICWKEMNTQLILDKHCVSPTHLKEEKGRETVQRLKEEYKQLKELHQKK